MRRGLPIVISAPSGAGKTTLVRRLRQQLNGLTFSVSHTTRPPRAGEQDGRDYHFVARDDFARMVEQGAFAEWAEVHGNLYGTSFQSMEQELERGRDVILDIDVQGALQLAAKRDDAVLIFIRPPNMAELRRRLEARGADSPQVIEQRLRNAAGELEAAHRYSHVVVNDDLERATGELVAVVRELRRQVELSPRSRHNEVT